MEFDISVTKEDILNKISQEEIFEKILSVKIEYGKKFINPLRMDKRPTVSFKWFGDTLVMADYSGWFTGNCFQLVMKINYCSYKNALELIYRDFNLKGRKDTEFKPLARIEAPKIFKTYKESLTPTQLEWWSEFKITEEILNLYEVSKCREAHVNNYNYYYFDSDPCFHYTVRNLEGDFREKLYFPKRTEYRFMGNIPKDSWYVQGLWQLQDSETLIITKSLKDVMAMKRFDVQAIALNSESTLLYEPVLEYLSARYNKIYVNMDYDYAGIKMMNKYKKKGFPLLYFKNFKNIKDFADYCKLNDEKTIINFIKNLKNENY
jgi:hypothetical protein